MKHITICKYLALICLVLSVLLTVCACDPSGGETAGTTADTKNESTTLADETTTPTEDETTTPTEDETNDPNVANTYTITVLDPDGAPLPGAFITLANDQSIFARTDANGVATLPLTPAIYMLKIQAGAFGEITHVLTPDFTNVTINLAPVEDSRVEYKITVIDEEGNAIEGAKVQLCVGDLCQLPVNTDANGIATVRADQDTYTVKVSKDGYVANESSAFSLGVFELTVTLTKN